MAEVTDEFLVLSTRVLSGEAGAAERRRFDELLRQPENSDLYRDLATRWQAAPPPEAPAFTPPASLLRAAQVLPSVAGASPHSGRSCLSWPWLWAAAAALVIGLFVFRFFPGAGSVGPWRECVATAGERAEIELEDGTRITLHAGSTLSYPATFERIREVRLRGEAYFDVRHDPNRKFIVHADGFDTTVLGTKFDISAWPGDALHSVALVEGQVRVTSHTAVGGATTVLSPGQQWNQDPRTGGEQQTTFAPESATSWTRGLLVFHRTPLVQVARSLQHRFGVPIEIVDPRLTELPIEGRFDGESLGEILDTLAYAGGVAHRTILDGGAIVRIELDSR